MAVITHGGPVNPAQVIDANASIVTCTARKNDTDGTCEVESPDVDEPTLTTTVENLAYDPDWYPASNNAAVIRDKARKALTSNADYLALTSPSNAQVVEQVRRLTRQANGLIRLELRALDSTDGT